ANSTGAGGGIVFLPAFTVLGLSVPSALATSFAIQCFGMTSGALTWLALARSELHSTNHSWEQLNPMLWLTVPPSLAGLLLAQQLMPQPPFDIHILFSVFSITIGSLMLYRILHKYRADEFYTPNLTDKNKQLIIASCFVGGIITSWLSIGVGEILAIVLLMLGYNVRFTVTIAVCVSAISVLVALPYYVVVGDTINYSVLLFAGFGAMIGGYIARHLAMAISPRRLKTLLSLWIIFSGFVYLGAT
ncbi:MAG: putative membrane protein YfcA, partial [Phenylobacterium sp.]